MYKKIAFVVALVLACGVAQAATVYLKNGSSISGAILSRTKDSVKLDVSGVALTYYSDEIDRIDAQEAQGSAPVAASPVAKVAEPLEPTTVVPPAPEVSNPAVDEVPKVKPAASVAPTVPIAPVLPVMPAASSKTDVYAGMSKRDLVLRFIDVFGTRKSMISNFAQMAKTLPPPQADVFEKTFKVEEIIEMLVPLYDQHFTEEDLKTLIDFYLTPAGKKLVETIPLIMNESVGVTTKYFEAHMPELKAGLKERGVTSKP